MRHDRSEQRRRHFATVKHGKIAREIFTHAVAVLTMKQAILIRKPVQFPNTMLVLRAGDCGMMTTREVKEKSRL